MNYLIAELEVVYEQLGKWLEEEEILPTNLETQAMREKAVMQFAGNLLKRTLSESFVGIPLNEGELPEKSVKVAARSLSLELARHKSKLAAQLVSSCSYFQYYQSYFPYTFISKLCELVYCVGFGCFKSQ